MGGIVSMGKSGRESSEARRDDGGGQGLFKWRIRQMKQ